MGDQVARVPSIAALEGSVIGGSFERALLCHIRVAGESARMRLPEIGHGVVPDSGGTARLPQMAGHGLAADLALTGRILGAEEALRHGIASRVVPAAEVDATALAIARTIAKAPTLRRIAKPLAQQSMQQEPVAQAMVFAPPDYAEFKQARAEQRQPKYRGR